jgi:hypothetical protein
VDEPNRTPELEAIASMVRSLADQVSAFQRDRLPPPNPQTPCPMSDVADLARVVLELQSEIADLRAELLTEVRTNSIVVDDGVRQVTITPGHIVVQRRTDPDDRRSGASVHIRTLVRSAEVMTEAASADREFGVTATMNANWEGSRPVAVIAAQTGTDIHDANARELRVEDRSDSPTLAPLGDKRRRHRRRQR